MGREYIDNPLTEEEAIAIARCRYEELKKSLAQIQEQVARDFWTKACWDIVKEVNNKND